VTAWFQVKRTPRGKLHLVRNAHRRTACGFNLLSWMEITPVALPWQGEDRCAVCLRILASEQAKPV
jgi:hypothetical protein